MCGIIGYVGPRSCADILLNGLRRMEYRGYDSAGLALVEAGQLKVIKKAGKIAVLAEAVASAKPQGQVGIGHTRWATHGAPTERNAHPHQAGSLAIVHNGIIENFAQLKAELEAAGTKFKSQTDTEVLAHLILAARQQGADLPEAVIAALGRVVGTFGLAVVEAGEPQLLVAARRGSPLLIGAGKGELFVASDATAVVGHTKKVVYLEDDEVAICTPAGYKIVDLDNRERRRQAETLELEPAAIEKGGYEHFLMKEIMDQPTSITDILRGRLDVAEGTAHLGGLNLDPAWFRTQRRFLIIGCGTAYYAGLLGKYMLERLTGLPVDVEYGSEFRYRDAALSPHTLGVVISQSGETADTLASLRELKNRGVHSLGLVNVVGSSVAREVDGGIYLHAGPEISVASTKAFSAQVIAQLMLGLKIARHRDMGAQAGREIAAALAALPKQVEAVLAQAPAIKKLARKYAHFQAAMYLGRDALYPVAVEGSHKLKEISYIHAEAYPAGEMKHGANALIDENLLVVFLAPQNDLYPKAISNLQEVNARGGTVLVVASEGDRQINKLADEVIRIPKSSVWTQPLLANIPLQLFAYYMAVEKGTDVDQPRNLAKSVTVE